MAGWIGLAVLASVIVVPWVLMSRRQRLRTGRGARPMFRERQRLIGNRIGKPPHEHETFRAVRQTRYGIRGRRDAE